MSATVYPATASLFRNGRLQRLASSSAVHSVGVFFEHVTTLLNMRELEDEGKVMALADYASPIDDDENPLLRLITVSDGTIRCAHSSHVMFRELRRIHWHYANEQFAYMAQRVVEDVCVKLAKDAVRRSNEPRLAIAGGVASNIKATRLIRLLPEVEAVHVFPHMGDGGLALGAAVACAHLCGQPLSLDFSRLDLGPAFADQEAQEALVERGLLGRAVLRRCLRPSVTFWRTTRSCCGRREAWNTARVRSVTAVFSHVPIVRHCATV